MQQRPLFKGGELVSAIGFGAWPIGGGMGQVNEAEAVATVRASIDCGITLVDTAQAYRSSESILGKALKDGYRERAFIASKVSGHYSPAHIQTALENSLRAMEIEVIDLYQIHHWNPDYPIAESMAALVEHQRAGKIRYIGVSNFTADQMRQAAQTAPFQTNQVAYNMIDRGIETDAIPYCAEHGIGILAHSPLAKGLLGGKYKRDHVFPPDDERSRFPRFNGVQFQRALDRADALMEAARDKGVTLAQMAVAWTLHQPTVASVLVGAKTPAQILEFARAGEITWSADELARVDAILARFVKA